MEHIGLGCKFKRNFEFDFADQIVVGQEGHSAFDQKNKQYSDASCEMLHMIINGTWNGFHTFPMSNLFCIWYGLHMFMAVNEERKNQESNSLQCRCCDFTWCGFPTLPMSNLF